jgi:hypothetical protein
MGVEFPHGRYASSTSYVGMRHEVMAINIYQVATSMFFTLDLHGTGTRLVM